MNIKKSAKNDFLLSLKDDYTEMWVLFRFISENAPEFPKSKIVNLTKEIVQELVEECGAYVVDTKTELKKEMSTNDIFFEIDKVYNETNEKPSIGDGIWFGID